MELLEHKKAEFTKKERAKSIFAKIGKAAIVAFAPTPIATHWLVEKFEPESIPDSDFPRKERTLGNTATFTPYLETCGYILSHIFFSDMAGKNPSVIAYAVLSDLFAKTVFLAGVIQDRDKRRQENEYLRRKF